MSACAITICPETFKPLTLRAEIWRRMGQHLIIKCQVTTCLLLHLVSLNLYILYPFLAYKAEFWLIFKPTAATLLILKGKDLHTVSFHFV